LDTSLNDLFAMPVFVKWLIGLGGAMILILIALFPLGLIKKLQGEAIGEHFANQGSPSTAVNLGQVQRTEWDVTIPSVGSVASVQGVVVRPEVAGVVRTILFTAGSDVAAGDLLIELDTTVERANLEQAEAELDLAVRTLKRVEKAL
jgi:membrane fusion protein (multidrug efflux system)